MKNYSAWKEFTLLVSGVAGFVNLLFAQVNSVISVIETTKTGVGMSIRPDSPRWQNLLAWFLELIPTLISAALCWAATYLVVGIILPVIAEGIMKAQGYNVVKNTPQKPDAEG